MNEPISYVTTNKSLPNGMTEKQQQAVGSLIMWRYIQHDEYDKGYRAFLAKGCIRMQTYFDTKIVGELK